MAMADDIFNTLTRAIAVSATQARYDAEAFAREKKGYAARLRIVRSYLSLEIHVDIVSSRLALAEIDALIADLERE